MLSICFCRNSPGHAQGVSDNRLEIEIQQETRTKIIEWSNNCAIADVFVELLLFLVQLLNNSLTRGGAVREPWDMSVVTRFQFGGPFFQSVCLHPFFQHKITLFTKLAPKMTPKSTPNPILNLSFIILWKPCFGLTLQCFYYILRFPPAPNGTRNTTKTEP